MNAQTCHREAILIYWLSLAPTGLALFFLRQAVLGDGHPAWWWAAAFFGVLWIIWLWMAYEIDHAPEGTDE